MNILGRHVLFRRKSVPEVSRFAGVLPRIRAIRDQCDWQPLSSAAAVEQRRERVQSARRRIIYHPVPYERGLEWRLPLRRTWWLWLAGGIALLCAIALTSALTDTDRAGGRTASQFFSYQLPVRPPFLSEPLALEKAMESLSKVVAEPLSWQPLENPVKQRTLAPDGRQYVYLSRLNRTNANQGFLQFENPRAIGVWTITVMLDRDRVVCSVSPPVQKP